MPRVVPEGGATICGTFFPQGVRPLLSYCESVQSHSRTKLTTMAGTQTVVGINSWVAHHNSSIFGPDVNAFHPERWLVEDKEQLSAMGQILHARKFCPLLLRDCLIFS